MGGGQGSGSLWGVHEQLQSLVPLACDSPHPTTAVCDMHLCHTYIAILLIRWRLHHFTTDFPSYKGTFNVFVLFSDSVGVVMYLKLLLEASGGVSRGSVGHSLHSTA